MKLFQRPKPGDGERHDYDLDEVKEVASQARRLAIYDRPTGLFAYWYLQLRAAEEISRAHRHGKSVVCASIWAPTQLLIDEMCLRLRAGLRDHDLAAYLDNGHFVLLLTDTDDEGADIVLKRLLQGVPEVGAAAASFPIDGATFDELLERAKARAGRGRAASQSAA
ncbi:MAG: GGDEF domain-containing protein [Chloroflexota bacterium]|nr:GGDEF domain-containing protein [Chloroflexota bacterium]